MTMRNHNIYSKLLTSSAFILFVFVISFFSSITLADDDNKNKHYSSYNVTYIDELKNRLSKSFTDTLSRQMMEHEISNYYFKVDYYGDVSEMPGFGYYGVTTFVNNTVLEQNFVIYDGKYIVPHVKNLFNNTDLFEKYKFKYVNYNVDTTKLTFWKGDANSTNRIIIAGDFTNKYFRMTIKFLENRLENSSDYAIFVMHVPYLGIDRQRSTFYALLFELCKALNLDTNINKIIDGAYDSLDVVDILREIRANLMENGGDIDEFNSYVYSSFSFFVGQHKLDSESKNLRYETRYNLFNRVNTHISLSHKYFIASNPTIFYLGHRSDGFDRNFVQLYIIDHIVTNN